MKRSEIRNKFDEIVDFAGIGEYLDTPVKRYSSGMYARLGFSVAAHVDPEIMLVDEVLAVGDLAFRKKCYDRMLQLIQNGTTLVFVSHDFGAVQKVCSRCLVLYRGTMSFDGPSAEATAEYSNILRRAAVEKEVGDELAGEEALSQMVMSHGAVIERVELFHTDGSSGQAFESQETVRARMTVRFDEDAPAPIFACTIRREDGQIVYDFTTDWSSQKTPDFQKNTRATVEFSMTLNLIDGTYHLGVDLAYTDLSMYYDRLIRAMDFVVRNKSGAQGIAELNAAFAVAKVEELLPQVSIP
jgi:lipopolysaccharide transport system ATP-binding protein